MKRVAKYGRLGPIYEFIPRPVYRFGRAAWLDLQSIPRRLSGGGAEPWLIFHNYGGTEFYQSGEDTCARIETMLGLKADAHLLDIGCGTGRMAWPWRERFNDHGGYIGFDVSANAIAFAKKLMRDDAERFAFHHADLFSKEYNPRATMQAKDYKFPCENSWADGAMAISLFTHLLEADARNFLNELSRCLKPTGKAYITAYLVNDEVRERMENKTAMLSMLRYDGPVWAGDLDTPEAATGYDEDAFRSWLDESGLQIEKEVSRGGWSQPDGNTYNQDVFVISKKN